MQRTRSLIHNIWHLLVIASKELSELTLERPWEENLRLRSLKSDWDKSRTLTEGAMEEVDIKESQFLLTINHNLTIDHLTAEVLISKSNQSKANGEQSMKRNKSFQRRRTVFLAQWTLRMVRREWMKVVMMMSLFSRKRVSQRLIYSISMRALLIYWEESCPLVIYSVVGANHQQMTWWEVVSWTWGLVISKQCRQDQLICLTRLISHHNSLHSHLSTSFKSNQNNSHHSLLVHLEPQSNLYSLQLQFKLPHKTLLTLWAAPSHNQVALIFSTWVVNLSHRLKQTYLTWVLSLKLKQIVVLTL